MNGLSKDKKTWSRTDPLGRSIQVKYCSVLTRYWVTTSKQTTKQHSLVDNWFLISKHTLPLQGNAFANKHVTTETIGVQQWTVFSTWSEPKCYNRDKFRSVSFVTGLWESCKGVCEEMTWSVQWKNPHCPSRYQGTTGEDTADWKDLAYTVLICKVWRSAMAL
jgi:hypothetical protein